MQRKQQNHDNTGEMVTDSELKKKKKQEKMFCWGIEANIQREDIGKQ